MTRIIPLIILAALLAGCAVSPTEAKRFTSDIRTRAAAIIGDARRLHPTTQEAGIVQDISDNAENQILSCDEADKIIDAASRNADNLTRKNAGLEGSIGVKLEKLAWIGLYSGIGLWLIMRIVVPTLNPGSKFAKLATEGLPLMNGAIQKVESTASKLVTETTASKIVTK